MITVSSADDIAVGDIVHVNCNWSGIDNVIAKIDAIAENAVTLRNINTTNKNKYAAGGGSGSIRKIEEWTELPQITEVSKSGGDQNTTQIQFLSDDRQRNLNTYKSAVSQTYSTIQVSRYIRCCASWMKTKRLWRLICTFRRRRRIVTGRPRHLLTTRRPRR